MSVVPSKYGPPPFASERWGPPPWRSCRISSDWHATAIATAGESTLTPTGPVKGKAAIRADLERGWRGFKRADDENGWPDQGDVDDYHGAMWPTLPMPTIGNSRDFGDVWQAIGRYAVSISLRLSAVPAGSPLRQWTDADHQVVLDDTREGGGRVLDPMSLNGKPYWAPKAHILEAAKAISGGLIVCELYPRGKWTAEALAVREMGAASLSLEAQVRRLRNERNDAMAALAKCEAGSDPDCVPLVEAARANALSEAEAAASAAIKALAK
jgi:hypothetical protein